MNVVKDCGNRAHRGGRPKLQADRGVGKGPALGQVTVWAKWDPVLQRE
jgi:hypothetical protein